MKSILLTSLLSVLSGIVMAQSLSIDPDSVKLYFDQVKTATQKEHQIWGKNIYGPILLINPQTLQVYANSPDSAGVLKLNGDIYTGFLPKDIQIANTSMHWSGTNWATIMLPLPQPKYDRISLLSHELFHVAQPALGFIINESPNNHLDKKEARIYLRLELEALKQAIQATSKSKVNKHLKDAFAFRKYRQSMYSGSDVSENKLELNEGLAEYTGEMTCGRDNSQRVAHFVNNINRFHDNPTFVRSFAYQTTPVYGYLLSLQQKEWNKKVTGNTNLTTLFIKAFNIKIQTDLKEFVDNNMDSYNGQQIIKEEAERETRINKLIAEYTDKFIEQPHFDIQSEQMSISFDPRNIMSMDDKGMVYPNIKVIDNWGILTVSNGALISPMWNKITVTIPTKIEENTLIGDGWVLELKNGYTLSKDDKTGNYTLKKN